MRVRTTLAILLAAAGSARAGDEQLAALRSMSLSEVLEVDISTGTSKFLRQAPAVAFVISGEDIALMGARNLLEVLEAVPGMASHLFQAVTNTPLIDVRAAFTQVSGSVLILRDGKPLRLLSNQTMPEIFLLPVQFIERIEIARGPASAVRWKIVTGSWCANAPRLKI